MLEALTVFVVAIFVYAIYVAVTGRDYDTIHDRLDKYT